MRRQCGVVMILVTCSDIADSERTDDVWNRIVRWKGSDKVATSTRQLIRGISGPGGTGQDGDPFPGEDGGLVDAPRRRLSPKPGKVRPRQDATQLTRPRASNVRAEVVDVPRWVAVLGTAGAQLLRSDVVFSSPEAGSKGKQPAQTTVRRSARHNPPLPPPRKGPEGEDGDT